MKYFLAYLGSSVTTTIVPQCAVKLTYDALTIMYVNSSENTFIYVRSLLCTQITFTKYIIYMWNELTFLWIELTILWNDLSMERNERIPCS